MHRELGIMTLKGHQRTNMNNKVPETGSYAIHMNIDQMVNIFTLNALQKTHVSLLHRLFECALLFTISCANPCLMPLKIYNMTCKVNILASIRFDGFGQGRQVPRRQMKCDGPSL
jgi:hypothetical protein